MVTRIAIRLPHLMTNLDQTYPSARPPLALRRDSRDGRPMRMSGLVGLQTLSAAIRMLSAGVQWNYLVGRRLCRIEQGGAGQCIAMVADVPAIGPLNHRD